MYSYWKNILGKPRNKIIKCVSQKKSEKKSVIGSARNKILTVCILYINGN